MTFRGMTDFLADLADSFVSQVHLELEKKCIFVSLTICASLKFVGNYIFI